MLFRVHYVVEALVESSIRRRKMDGLSKSCVMAVSHIRGLGEMKYTLTTILAFSWFSRNSEVENPQRDFPDEDRRVNAEIYSILRFRLSSYHSTVAYLRISIIIIIDRGQRVD